MPENPVKTGEAARQLGVGATRMAAIKRAMGLNGRWVFVSEVRKWLRSHPEFKERDVYARPLIGSPAGKRPGLQVEAAHTNREP